ncbi:cobalt transporter [Dactylosporangium salmoneum]|uniref:Nickel/cobalt efflux system n=1 Tax=Dactylosporangium salmoneum TaxID=53361 RepID=A0ABN3HDM1_9ACTN
MNAGSLSDRLQELLHAPGIPVLAFALAFLAGAGHAVAPGHGKSLAAAYLAGSKGRIRDAAWLGGSVAAMHTLSVLVIGVAWTFLSLSDAIRMEELTSWLQVAAGLLVLATGLWMLRRHVRGHAHGHHHHHGHSHTHGPAHAHAAAHDHAHAAGDGHGHDDEHPHGAEEGPDHGHNHEHPHGAEEGPDHDHDHGHPHGHNHEHPHGHDHGLGEGRRPGLLLLGMSGGLTPSPSAFLVFATGLFLGRAGFALLLVLTFGLGMAVVLFGVGVMAVAGSAVVTRGARSRRLLGLAARVAPIVAASGITVFGAGLVTVAAVHLAAVA